MTFDALTEHQVIAKGAVPGLLLRPEKLLRLIPQVDIRITELPLMDFFEKAKRSFLSPLIFIFLIVGKVGVRVTLFPRCTVTHHLLAWPI